MLADLSTELGLSKVTVFLLHETLLVIEAAAEQRGRDAERKKGDGHRCRTGEHL